MQNDPTGSLLSVLSLSISLAGTVRLDGPLKHFWTSQIETCGEPNFQSGRLGAELDD
jgi:hypothetical protein